MNKTKELKIDSTLWATPSKLVNLLDFNPDKISIKTKNHGKIIKCKEIKLFDDDLPIGDMFKINSTTIVMESLIEKDNIFYPEIALNHCSYEI